MRRLTVFLVPICAVLSACGSSEQIRGRLPVPESQIALDTPEGQALLRGAEAAADYGPLSVHFVTQETGTYCGPASLAMVLNASGIARPALGNGEPFALFDQRNVFSPAARAVKDPKAVRKDGLTLAQLGAVLEAHGAETQIVRAAEMTPPAFRDAAIRALDAEGEFVLVNYLRAAIGQESGGHISPLAAYDADTDMFLVLDVARYKYPPVWISTADLHAAMNTAAGPHSRGFLIAKFHAAPQ